MNNFFKKTIIVVASILIFGLLVWYLYVETNIGFSNTFNGYMPIYAPAWFEALVTTLCLPTIVGYAIYDKLYA